MNTSVPIAGLPPVLKPIRLKAKFASSLLKFRLGLVLPDGNPLSIILLSQIYVLGCGFVE